MTAIMAGIIKAHSTPQIAALCEKLLSHASPLLHYAEEIDPHSGRHLGNFPQAFTHDETTGTMTNDTARAKRLSALAHPIRLEVLTMTESVPISASEAAVALGEPLGTVAYHFRVLHTAGLIELVSTERRRGSVESFYQATSSGWAEFAGKLDELIALD
jgi:DNA-binding transcriptional ArsR family regulator